ncbi:hypothetical protein WR25_20818 isoform A [Diploscapter pachys]|uniref:DOMON domain-containing protein n=1 Tax=Diploscapter pachys TaxID=2018661 RepID=A0A2A2LDV5_9BILA|nr:hypothetical protein WR25_20818 isoform A [Diploscapter pachys]
MRSVSIPGTVRDSSHAASCIRAVLLMLLLLNVANGNTDQLFAYRHIRSETKTNENPIGEIAESSGEEFNDTVVESGVSPSLLEDIESLSDSSNSLVKNIRKRAANFYNGIVTNDFYSPFNVDLPIFPQEPVIALGRPLQQGREGPIVQYVAQWSPRGRPPHWGAVTFSRQSKAEGSFIADNRIYNLTSMKGEPIRLLQYVGNEQSNNFKFAWIIARDADPATVLSLRESTNSCSPRLAPAVYRDSGYEFLGEADIDNRIMKYVAQGHINVVDKTKFTNNVYLLTKQQCSCSCPAQRP